MQHLVFTPDHPTQPTAMEADAETVRSYLVQLRGGAPFLSGADGRLLIHWLESGISVPHILYALDKAAERRRKRRARGNPVRSRLTLSACRAAIEKQAALPAPATGADIGPWLLELRAMDVQGLLVQAKQTLLEDVGRIQRGAPDTMARAAIEACRAFQAATWRAAEGEAQSGACALLVEAHGEQDMRGLEGAARASGARADLEALEVEARDEHPPLATAGEDRQGVRQALARVDGGSDQLEAPSQG